MDDSKRELPTKLPRVAITYCTQCRWMLRAAYFAQELLSTFGTSIGEIALIPATGGLFTVRLTHVPSQPESESSENLSPIETLIWDRKAEGGFPEAKILKQRIRNFIDPERHLGHSDTPSKSKSASLTSNEKTQISSSMPAPDPLEQIANAADGAGSDPVPTCSECA